MKEKILVVDDDPAILRIVSLVLENNGYDVNTANSGEEAYQLAFSLQPDLMVLDVNMPNGWSGFVTCQKFKSDSQLSAIPIIFLTGKVEQFEEGFELGAADYVLKPFNHKEFIVRTQFHLKMRRLVNEVQQANESLESKVQARTQDLTDSNKKLNQVIHERKLLESRLKHQIGTDFLTQLPSGVSFENDLQTLLDKRQATMQNGVLIFLDLFKFEVINQGFGWDAGDYVLIQISKLLQSQLGHTAMIGRLGGDQFAVFLKQATTASAKKIARGLVDCISGFPIKWKGQTIQAGVCVGFCIIDSTESSARKITSKAIHASVIAKGDGVGSIVNYQDHAVNQGCVEANQDLASRIQSALDSNGFSLFYQRVNPLQRVTGQLPSIEILLRLKGEFSDRWILPSEFFEFSEQNKIKSKIDLWVVKETLNWLQNNQTVGSRLSHVSINLTAETIANPMFLITLENLLEGKAISPSLLCFEISEPDALISIDRTRAFLTRLKALGCKTCIDNFGVQTTIIQYLKELNVDYLKMDGSFIRDYANNPVNAVLCEMLKKVADLSSNIMIAKHIEQGSVAKSLTELGIDFAQGSLFHEPEPLSNLDNPESGLSKN
jgi:diguanylate cyclase (GGDEF)-like protein